MYAILSVAPQCHAGKSVMDTHRQSAFSFWFFVVGSRRGGVGIRGENGVVATQTQRQRQRQTRVRLACNQCVDTSSEMTTNGLFKFGSLFIYTSDCASSSTSCCSRADAHTRRSGNAFKEEFMPQSKLKGKRDSRKRKHLIGLVFNQNKKCWLVSDWTTGNNMTVTETIWGHIEQMYLADT